MTMTMIGRRWERRRRAALAGTLTVGALLTAGMTSAFTTGGRGAEGGAAPAPTPAYSASAVFNVPADDGTRDYAIEERLVALADATPAGATIRVAMYSWSSYSTTRATFAQALIDAHQRGVNVRVVIDQTGGGVNNRPDNDAIVAMKQAGVDVHTCGLGKAGTACIGPYSGSINHNKLAMFSTSGSAKRVVVFSSQNLTFQQNNYFNNAVVIAGDADLYDATRRYFNDLRAEQRTANYFGTPNGYFRSPTTGVTLYFSPRTASDGSTKEEAATDTVRGTLTYLSGGAGCSVDTVQSQFTDYRTAVAQQLLRIARAGCKVRVVHDSMSAGIASILAMSPNISVKHYHDAEPDNIDGRVVTVHSKYLIVKGTYNGTAGRTIVFTGSHNLTGPALRENDESYVKIENQGVSSAFATNFATVWARAKS